MAAIHAQGSRAASPLGQSIIVIIVSLLSFLLPLTTEAKVAVYNALVSAVSWLVIHVEGAIAVGALVVVCRHFWLQVMTRNF